MEAMCWSYCRSAEQFHTCNLLHSETDNTIFLKNRYRVVSFKSSHQSKESFYNISLLDLSGTTPELFSDTFHCDQNKEEGLANSDNASVGYSSITNCFTDINQASLTNKLNTDSDVSGCLIWGRLTCPAELLNKYPNPSNVNAYIGLTIGNQILRGKVQKADDDKRILVMRKVPEHCSCICGVTDDIKGMHNNHSGYYEICGVVYSRLLFNSRPTFFYNSMTEQSNEEWYLYATKNMHDFYSNWFLLTVSDDILDDILLEKAYFKSVDGCGIVFCICSETYNIERIEIGGTALLLYHIKPENSQLDAENMLSIIGSSPYIHNLIRVTPTFGNIPKLSFIAASSIVNTLLVSDMYIEQFLLHQNPMWPCYYLYMQHGFKFVEQHTFGEFAIKLLCIIPIYYSQHLKTKRPISELTVRDYYNIVRLYPESFEFIPVHSITLSLVFQLLLEICDIDISLSFETLYSISDSNEFILKSLARINLFKVQKIVAQCIATINDTLFYEEITSKVDSVLFNDAIPSYIFDELIQWMFHKNIEPNEQDYVKCLEFYYNNTSFGDLSNTLLSCFGVNCRSGYTSDVLYNKTGANHFIVGSKIKLKDLSKTPCFNYSIYKLHTKGLPLLRYNYSMNSLLLLCRCPMSLHVSFLANKMVAVVKNQVCTLQIYPKHEIHTLKDALSAIFKLNNLWHLEVIQEKYKHFFTNNTALECVTGGPNFHARLYVSKQINNKNCTLQTEINDLQTSVVALNSKLEQTNRIIEEEYMIINANVPVI